MLQDGFHGGTASSGRYSPTRCQVKVFGEHLQTQDRKTALLNSEHRHSSIKSYKKPIIPPWKKAAFSWNYFNSKNNTAGTLIYTDGSKMNNRVGGAFVVYDKGLEIYSHGFRLSDHESVYSAERMAIEATIDFAINNNLQLSSIISDLRSVLQAISNPNNIDIHILQIKDKISNYNGIIHLYWIKAHEGFDGNEKADEYAKVATMKNSIDHISGYGIPYIKKMIKKEIVAQWQDRWSNSNKGREVFTFSTEVKTSRIQSSSPTYC
ncbi:uncharacterized protein CDAR_57051 [Caerostris darwini]|uniref:RNase H type-1 domain-containing protein n=1 Tax=Caerostris darwini TaxID=1538125 RepID=A0AAV4W9Z7_9ARAC|nr:uncharacterized protein CDAR_57051 [Caerostris darwini]